MDASEDRRYPLLWPFQWGKWVPYVLIVWGKWFIIPIYTLMMDNGYPMLEIFYEENDDKTPSFAKTQFSDKPWFSKHYLSWLCHQEESASGRCISIYRVVSQLIDLKIMGTVYKVVISAVPPSILFSYSPTRNETDNCSALPRRKKKALRKLPLEPLWHGHCLESHWNMMKLTFFGQICTCWWLDPRAFVGIMWV